MAHKKKKPYLKPKKVFKNTPTNGEMLKKKRTKNRARIIVRNLPFKNLDEDFLRGIFSEFGNIIDVNLLKKSDGSYVGCGFVEFEKRTMASKAILKTTGKVISGRPIIVDWALPKQTFMQKAQTLEDDVVNIKKEDNPDSDDESPELVDYTIDSIGEGTFKSEENDEDDADGSDIEGEEEDDSDDSENDSSDEGDIEQKDVNSERKPSNDAEDGRTVFIKNVPFSAKNDDLKKCVEEFGPVVYAVICIDKLTEHSKGSAFVKFQSAESAEKCIRNSKQIYINEQPLDVMRAVNRDKLEDEKKKQKKLAKAKDSRNLYLVREGVIMAGSPAAATVSSADMAKRLQIEQWKTQILRNLNMFVSKTRLVIHNIPSTYTDKDLRNLFIKYSSPNAIVKEARVMVDKKKVDGQGQPLSKEVGFVSFTNHEDALTALREINNNPDVFTPNRRPIIAFSIENRQILNMKQKRLEKSRSKLLENGKEVSKSKGTEKLNRKQRRFLKRKKMIIEKRQAAKELQRQHGKVSTQGIPTDSKSKVKLGKRKRKDKNSMGIPEKKQHTSEFEGVAAEPGKILKLRSRTKLKKQEEIHKKIVKDRKKTAKGRKAIQVKERTKSKNEPTLKNKKPILDNDNFSKLVSSYKNKIESAASFKKWYES